MGIRNWPEREREQWGEEEWVGMRTWWEGLRRSGLGEEQGRKAGEEESKEEDGRGLG